MVQRYYLAEDDMVPRYDVLGNELCGDAFYEDWVEVVRYEDYAELEAELQKYKDQLRDSSVQIKELQKDMAELQREAEHKTEALDYLYTNKVLPEQSGRRKEDTQECKHEWSRYIVHPYRKICLVCGVKE